MNAKIKLGISACLLGESVRYDGGHKLDYFLRDRLGAYIQWVPVCPEVEYGLPTPREAMRLVGTADTPRLVTQKTNVDHTKGMVTWAQKRTKELEKQDLCGFVFKSGSPSSGLFRVKVYNAAGNAVKNGMGMFPREFTKQFPLLPVEEEGRLNDENLRENFIERVFVYSRWKTFYAQDATLKGLVDFHTDHKLLIMSHSPASLRILGALVAHATNAKRKNVFTEYCLTLMHALTLEATVKKHTNVLQHIMGYFKKDLTFDEKQELLSVIEQYHKQYVPLVVPLVLLQHYVRKYEKAYLARQFYLHPHPDELMLRNHV